MRAGVALSEHADTETAVAEVGRQLFTRGLLEGASAALVWATPHHAPQAEAMRQALMVRLGLRRLAGCIASGVIAGDREVIGTPGLSVMVFSDSEQRRFSTRLRGNLSTQPEELGRDIAAGTEVDDLVFMMTTTRFLQMPLLLQGLCRGQGAIIGGGAGNVGREEIVFTGEGISRDGAAALIMEGCRPVVELTHSTRPISSLMEISGAQGRTITHLKGLPAVPLLGSILRDRKERGVRDGDIFIGLTHGTRGGEVIRGQYRVRPIMGITPGGGGLILGERPAPGAGLVFLSRGVDASRQDLNMMLLQMKERLDQKPVFGLLANCQERGEAFQGMPDFDASVIGAYLPEVPLGGFFGSFEIGPLRGVPAQHLYTAILGVGLG